MTEIENHLIKKTKLIDDMAGHRRLDFFDPEISEAPDVLPWTGKSEKRYGISLDPATAKITDSEKKALAALKEKGYKIYRNGWPDFLAINPETQKAFFVEVKSNGDVLSKKQIHLHNLLLDFFHLHVMVLRVVAGYVPDFADPEFDIKKYHTEQLDKCKKQYQDIAEAILEEKEYIESKKKEYEEISLEHKKIIEGMLNEITEESIEYKETEEILLQAIEQREKIDEIKRNLSDINDLIRTAIENTSYWLNDEDKIVKIFDNYIENNINKLNEKRLTLESAIKNLKHMQKKNHDKGG